tara:strand:- start:3712 stop:4329 length:618 start_codon:yes stop_codon:yes gene_type:complete
MEKSYRKNLIVVDNFYKDPDAVRDYALSVEYQEDKVRNWPGRDSEHEHGKEELTKVCSDIVGMELTTKSCNKCSYFRRTKIGQHGTQDVHFDPNPGLVWAGVIYLTPTFHPTGGTKFWKHKRTGWEFAPGMVEAEQHGIQTHNDMVDFFNTEGKDRSKWIETDNIAFKYNRLVMFNPFMWHSNGEWFGTDDQSARLVQLLFFHGK